MGRESTHQSALVSALGVGSSRGGRGAPGKVLLSALQLGGGGVARVKHCLCAYDEHVFSEGMLIIDVLRVNPLVSVCQTLLNSLDVLRVNSLVSDGH